MAAINNENDFEKVDLVSQDGAKAEIYLYGGHVASWHPAGETEQLYLSNKTIYKNGTPIRGGIPVCFPQFNNYGTIMKHGFARINPWELMGVKRTDLEARAEFALVDTTETQKIWPFAFSVKLTVTIGGQTLRTELSVTNNDRKPFAFTGALHTYLLVNDISKMTIEGLHKCMYKDSVTGKTDLVQNEEELTIQGEVDRVYINGPREVTIREAGRKLKFKSEGFKDIVVWNPGPEGCKGIKDMEPEDYRRMVCVEAAIVMEPQEVPSGKTWHGMQELTAI